MKLVSPATVTDQSFGLIQRDKWKCMRRKRHHLSQLTCFHEYFPMYTTNHSLFMCSWMHNAAACVETGLISYHCWLWCLIFSKEYELFSSWPSTVYLGICLLSHWRTSCNSVTFWRPFYQHYQNLLTHLCPTSET